MRTVPLFQLRDAKKVRDDGRLEAAFKARLFLGFGFRKLTGSAPGYLLFCFTVYAFKHSLIGYCRIEEQEEDEKEQAFGFNRKHRVFLFKDSADHYKSV